MTSRQSHRKDEHVSLAKKFHSDVSQAGFQALRLLPNALPESDFTNVSLKTTFGKLVLELPFYIEAMTGGSSFTKKLNQQLAHVAAETGLAMAVGSESVALKDPTLRDSFSIVRKVNPHGLIFANLSAGASLDECHAALELVQGDALELHLNAAQEAIMPEGDRSFHWAEHLQANVAASPVPVILKEVGFGMTQETMLTLRSLGVQYLNLGGHGGTNFAQIENFRRPQKDFAYLSDWGLTTVESLYEAHAVPDMYIAAAGGITNPLEIVKALYLGADAVGVAGTLLTYLIDHDVNATIELVREWITGLRTIFALLGVHSIAELRQRPAVLSSELLTYLQQRNLS
ncbi:Isopentenyl-diphosphate delta-isomerase, FMN-dependent [Fructilactobacillus florum 8D]|uniref:Isopentenyl-diphosphate delta-isomerase n=1 Tax=Fructilactobacillus florum 8D TaxID=1221538 RepID=W9EEY0_9LACO|nr:type 2 isopentenyl-diphosphate Delta-isomerase [Fructilactobacillus florum]EKK20956.1 Isopentenyl-diphosphate delta-isomerase, FMN-dependent [Fructilactobacillus florum 2F]ETO40637.1 Isopentenyl-diphosphate delta-isomerase, FMN-dependent [Fructilactobacillus florum 8D]